MSDRRVTLSDVARLAGTSPTTASLILNRKPNTRFSQDARDRVHAAAQALGYRPNVAARGLRTQKTQTIALISDQVAITRFASGLIKGALDVAEATGHVVLVMETGGKPARIEEAVGAALDRQVDGIIFAAMRAREIKVPEIPASTPVVMLNAASAHSQALSVLPDEEAGGRAAVDLLVAHGHRNGIALVGQNEEVTTDNYRSVTIARRSDGIQNAMGAHGLTFAAVEPLALWEPQSAFTATTAILERSPNLTAVLCMNDRIAFGVYQAVTEAGLRIPDDISIMSFDNDEVAAYLRPGLTTIALPYEDMGGLAVELLLEQDSPRETLVPMPIIRRASISAAKAPRPPANKPRNSP